MFWFLLSFSFSYTPGVLAKLYKTGNVNITSSGAVPIWQNEDWRPTSAEFAIDPSKAGENGYEYDWCTTCNKTVEDKQFVILDFIDKFVRVESYSIRNGCVPESCYCDENYCCGLQSWELQGSVDNATWNTLHTVDNATLSLCEEREFEIGSKKGVYRFVKLVQLAATDGCWSCFSINNIELNGVLIDNGNSVIDTSKEDVLLANSLNNTDDDNTATGNLSDDDDDDDIALVGRAPIRLRKKIKNR